MARRGARRPAGGTRAQRSGVTQRRKAGVLIQLDIRGGEEINRRLNKLRLVLARKAINQALKEGTTRIMKPAIDAGISTVSPGRAGTGLFKNKGTKVVKTSRRPAHMGYRVITPSRTDLNIQGDNEPYYPLLLEVGWQGMEGRHFMRNARDQKSGALNKFLRRTILKFIDEQVARQGKRDAVRASKGKKAVGAFRSPKQLAKFKARGLI